MLWLTRYKEDLMKLHVKNVIYVQVNIRADIDYLFNEKV